MLCVIELTTVLLLALGVGASLQHIILSKGGLSCGWYVNTTSGWVMGQCRGIHVGAMQGDECWKSLVEANRNVSSGIGP